MGLKSPAVAPQDIEGGAGAEIGMLLNDFGGTSLG